MSCPGPVTLQCAEASIHLGRSTSPWPWAGLGWAGDRGLVRAAEACVHSRRREKAGPLVQKQQARDRQTAGQRHVEGTHGAYFRRAQPLWTDVASLAYRCPSSTQEQLF